MKVHYFNDRHVRMMIRVQEFGKTMKEYFLEAHKGKEFNVFIPSGHTLFIKEWDYSVVLLASIEKPQNE